MAILHQAASVPGPHLLAGLLAAILILPGCEGSATQTTTGHSLSGTLVDTEGRPSAGATVTAWNAANLSPIGPGSAPVAMARTDAQGRFGLELDPGNYNIFAREGGGARAAGLPGIAYASGALDLGSSTLRPPGSVSGRVIAGGAPVREAFCYIPGSAFVAVTDTSGRFTLDAVPAGRYVLRYVGTGFAAALDTVEVAQDSALRLPDRELFPDVSLQPPALTGLRAAEDAGTGFVTLAWNPVRVEDLDGYVVETRIAGDSGAWTELAAPIPPWGPDTSAIPDTVRVDSNARWIFSQAAHIRRGTGPLDSSRLEYRVKAVDRDGNRSPAWSDTVSLRIRRPPALRTGVEVTLPGGAWDSLQCRDTLAFAVAFANPVVDSAVVVWQVKHKVLLRSTFFVLYSSYFEGAPRKRAQSDSLRWWWGRGLDSAGAGKLGPDQWSTPDSLAVKVTVDVGVRFGSVSRILDVVRPEPGCFRIRPPRDPAEDE